MDSLTSLHTRLDYLASGCRHWLIPRTGGLVVDCLTLLNAKSFQLWRYWEDPSSPVTKPALHVAIDSSTPPVLAQQWKDEAFGFVFPELAFLSEDVEIDVCAALTNFCKPLLHGLEPSKGTSKTLRNVLRSEPWLIFPLALSPFLEESASNYCLVVINDSELHELVGAELATNANLFQWQANSSDWPIPQAAEDLAELLWAKELA